MGNMYMNNEETPIGHSTESSSVPDDTTEVVEMIEVIEIDLAEFALAGKAVPSGHRYKVRIDDHQHKVEGHLHKGKFLLELVGKSPEEFALIEEFVGNENDVVEPVEEVDLSKPGLKGFITAHKHHHQPKFDLNIEGKIYPWDKDTVTTEDIERLGGWAAAQGVVVIDCDQNERTLKPGEIVHLEPGLGFAKRVRFKRGASNHE